MTLPPPRRSSSLLRTIGLVWLGLLAGFAIGVEWIRSRPAPVQPSGGIDLVGAGATLPYPLYRRWFADYGRESGVRINYFSVGSPEGIRLLLEGSVDFGAADRPLTAEERAAARCGPIEMPTVLGAVAVAYQLPGLDTPLRLDATVLADLFDGRIQRWNHPAIQRLNPDVALPDLEVYPIRRARSTGTSAVFDRYLAQGRRPAAATNLGMSQVEGNEGVTAAIRAQEGAIGAVEFSYAAQARLDVAALRNADGNFVAPSVASATAAANALLTPGTADTLTGLVAARGADAYPVVALTRIIADAALGDSTRGAHFVAFARWALREGATTAAEFGYTPLPESVTAEYLRRLDALRPGRCPAPIRAP